MRYRDEDREGRTHLRTQRHGRSRSPACTEGREKNSLPPGCGRGKLGRASVLPAARVIVAGYDGTALGREAVIQAGLQAGATGCVYVVYAYRSSRWYFSRFRRLRAARAAGRRAFEDLFSEGNWLPDTEYVTELISGRIADAVSWVADTCSADAIVVGAHRTGRIRATLRSISRERLIAPGIPVLIVPDPLGMAHRDTHASTFGNDSGIPDVETWW